jgi:hypothetical protein
VTPGCFHALTAVTAALTDAERATIIARFTIMNPWATRALAREPNATDVLQVCYETGVYDDITGPFLNTYRRELPRSPAVAYAAVARAALGDVVLEPHTVRELLARASEQ